MCFFFHVFFFSKAITFTLKKSILGLCVWFWCVSFAHVARVCVCVCGWCLCGLVVCRSLWCCFVVLLVGGAAFLFVTLWAVLLWVVIIFSPPPFGGLPFPSWVVLPSPPSFFRGVLPSTASLGWCCRSPPFEIKLFPYLPGWSS